MLISNTKLCWNSTTNVNHFGNSLYAFHGRAPIHFHDCAATARIGLHTAMEIRFGNRFDCIESAVEVQAREFRGWGD